MPAITLKNSRAQPESAVRRAAGCRNEVEEPPSHVEHAPRSEPAPDDEPAPGNEPARPYSPPRLTTVATVDELLDVLGPAQANYGGTGVS